MKNSLTLHQPFKYKGSVALPTKKNRTYVLHDVINLQRLGFLVPWANLDLSRLYVSNILRGSKLTEMAWIFVADSIYHFIEVWNKVVGFLAEACDRRSYSSVIDDRPETIADMVLNIG
nr:hypothetical protein [Tanacetum cinerariifolium]